MAEKLTLEAPQPALSPMEENLASVGVYKDSKIGYFYGGKTDDSGNPIKDSGYFLISEKEAIKLAGQVNELENKLKAENLENVTALVEENKIIRTNDDGNYVDKSGKLIPPQQLLEITVEKSKTIAMEQPLKAIGVYKDDSLDIYYYGGKQDDKGNLIDGSYTTVSKEQATKLSQAVTELESKAKPVFEGNIEGLLRTGRNSDDSYYKNNENYTDKDNNVIPPQKLLELAEKNRINIVLDHGANYVRNQRIRNELPSISTDQEEKLDTYKKDLKDSQYMASRAGNLLVAGTITGFANSQNQQALKNQPNAINNNSTMDMMLPVNINTGKCDGTTLKNLLIEQNSENCQTVAQVGVIASPQTPWAVGIKIPLGR